MNRNIAILVICFFVPACIFDCGDDDPRVNNFNNENNSNNENNQNNSNNGNNQNNVTDVGADSDGSSDADMPGLWPQQAQEIGAIPYTCTFPEMRLLSVPIAFPQIGEQTRFIVAPPLFGSDASVKHVVGFASPWDQNNDNDPDGIQVTVGTVPTGLADVEIERVQTVNVAAALDEVLSLFIQYPDPNEPTVWRVVVITDVDPVVCDFNDIDPPVCVVSAAIESLYDSFSMETARSSRLHPILEPTEANGDALIASSTLAVVATEGFNQDRDLSPGVGLFTSISVGSPIDIDTDVQRVYSASHDLAMRTVSGVTSDAYGLPYVLLFGEDLTTGITRPLILGRNGRNELLRMSLYRNVALDQWRVPPGFEPTESTFTFTESAEYVLATVLPEISVDSALSKVTFAYVSSRPEGMLLSSSKGSMWRWTGAPTFADFRSPQNLAPGKNDPMIFASTDTGVHLIRWNVDDPVVEYTQDLTGGRLEEIDEITSDFFGLGAGTLSFLARPVNSLPGVFNIGVLNFPFALATLSGPIPGQGFKPDLCMPD